MVASAMVAVVVLVIIEVIALAAFCGHGKLLYLVTSDPAHRSSARRCKAAAMLKRQFTPLARSTLARAVASPILRGAADHAGPFGAWHHFAGSTSHPSRKLRGRLRWPYSKESCCRDLDG